MKKQKTSQNKQPVVSSIQLIVFISRSKNNLKTEIKEL